MKLSLRGWLTTITLVLLCIVVVAAWPEIERAWALLATVDVWVLLLLLPVQLLSYYAAGSMIFAYLRSKGDLHGMSHWSMTRLALEFNFVNHILPSGGAAGFSYMAWVLGRHGVSPSRATIAQLIRFLLTFVSFVVLMLAAVGVLAVTSNLDRSIVLMTFILTVATIAAIVLSVWLVGNTHRLRRFAHKLCSFVNGVVGWVTRGARTSVANEETVYGFFAGIHDDYRAIRRDRKILFVPFLWGIITNVLDVLLIWISFWALGHVVDPAVLFIAFGIASIAGAVSVTPGGAGVYEAVMVAFLATTGITPEVAIAGTLLARVVLLTGTILFGYIFYQLTVVKYGKRPAER